MAKGTVEAWGLNGYSNRPRKQRRRRRGEVALMAPANSQIGENRKRAKRKRGEVEWRRRWCVPALDGVDGGDGEARASLARPIYRPARPVSRRRDIFPAALIHHVCSWLTSSVHFAIAGACPCARRNALIGTPVARRGDNHGVGVDEFTVRERGEEKRGRRGVPSSHRVSIYLCWHPGGAGGR